MNKICRRFYQRFSRSFTPVHLAFDANMKWQTMREQTTLSAILLLVMICFGISGVSAQQTKQWPELRGLRVNSDAVPNQARFIGAPLTFLSTRVASRPVPLHDFRLELEASRADNDWRYPVIGAAIGFGVGAILGLRYRNIQDERLLGTPINPAWLMPPVGAAAGALIGWAIAPD